MNLKEILTLLQFSYPRQEFTAENVKAYTVMLRDIDVAILDLAARQIIRESKWFPTIAELVGKVAELTLAKSGHLSAIEAYSIAMSGGRLREKYPDVLRAVEMSCGDTYNMRSGENTTADRARFIQAYDEITKQRIAEIASAPAVKQYLESNNGQVLIGENNHANN